MTTYATTEFHIMSYIPMAGTIWADTDWALEGDRGDDTIQGNTRSDWLKGSEGNDKLTGLDGRDKLEGGSDKDTLYGGDDEDSLYGGTHDGVGAGAAIQIVVVARRWPERLSHPCGRQYHPVGQRLLPLPPQTSQRGGTPETGCR